MRTITAIIRYYSLLPKFMVFLWALVITIAIGIVDYFTGFRLSFSLFHLIPIIMAAWAAGLRIGIILSVASAITWLLADMLARTSYPSALLPYWNTSVRLGLFLVTAYFVASLKKALNQEKQLARIDHVTGVANARLFYELSYSEIKRSQRYNRPFAIGYFDLDDSIINLVDQQIYIAKRAGKNKLVHTMFKSKQTSS